MKEKRDYYKGVPRLWRGGRVYHGIVCGKGIRPRHGRVSVTLYMVRENGEDIYRATSGTGIADCAIQIGRGVADRQGLWEGAKCL